MAKNYEGYLIDLDGTMYRGNEPIPEAVQFVQHLVKKDIPYMFVTNNSAMTVNGVVEKLKEMNIPASEQHIMTSSIATAKYIKSTDAQAKCLVVGEKGLTTAIKDADLSISNQDVDYVVMGIDRDISYEKLTEASLAVREGAKFISTNSDIAIPTERGLVPGNGALTSVVATSTGVNPTFIGKPESIIMEQALKQLQLEKDRVMMVGDNYDTDILAGIRSDIDTLMVFTGVTPYSKYDSLEIKPTYYVNSLSEWIPQLS